MVLDAADAASAATVLRWPGSNEACQQEHCRHIKHGAAGWVNHAGCRASKRGCHLATAPSARRQSVAGGVSFMTNNSLWLSALILVGNGTQPERPCLCVTNPPETVAMCNQSSPCATVPSGLYRGAPRCSCLRTGLFCCLLVVMLSMADVAVSLTFVATSLHQM
jgi:hypothetical protein